MTGTVRPFGQGVVLTVLTLGLYPLYWHYRCHRELLTWRGLPKRDLRVYHWYIGLSIGTLALNFVVTSKGPEAVYDEAFLAKYATWVVVAGVASATSLVLWILFVSRQIRLQREVKRTWEMPMRGSEASFFGLMLGWIPLVFLGGIGLVLAPIFLLLAYHRMQTDYNEIWLQVSASGWPTDTPTARPREPERPSPFTPNSEQPGTDHAEGPAPTPDSSTQNERPVYRQDVKCPSCGESNRVRGFENQTIDVRCFRCGTGGRIRIQADQ